MISKSRRKFKKVEGSPLKKRVSPLNNNRRGKANVEVKDGEDFFHEDFFEFEKDLIDLKPSRDLAVGAPNGGDFFTTDVFSTDTGEKKEMFEPKPKIQETKTSFIIMEEVEEKSESPSFGIILEDYVEDEPVFEFVQCMAKKASGERCKRQAPKGHKTCSIKSHRKQETSINKKENDENGMQNL